MSRKRTNVFLALAVAMTAVLVSGQFSPARADLAMVSPGTTTVLLPFPDWYADKSGVALAQCNFNGGAADPNCIPGAPLPGMEAFYWAGDPPVGSLDGGNASGVVMVMAIEAVPANLAPPPGQGVVFARIRIRADLVGPGVYTLIHPFGVETFTILTAGRRAINQTVDVPLPGVVQDFTGVLAGPIGPFLTCVDPAPPAGYLGNYGIPCTFTGSPFGQNLVRLTGPGTDNVATQLHISGKLVAPGTVTAPALTLGSATYSCLGTACQATLAGTADPAATLTASVAGTAGTVVGDGLGGFTANVIVPQALIPLPVDGLNTFPVQALVTASQAGLTLPTIEKRISLVDSVTITQVTHNTATGILTVSAKSGDPRAALREAQLGPLTAGTLYFDLNGFGGVSLPINSVNVVSTGGGAATGLTSFVSVPEKLRIKSATFNARRRRLTVTGTSSAKGATILLRSVTNPLGTPAVVKANGAFKAVARVNRKPRFVRVISSGGKSARVVVQ